MPEQIDVFYEGWGERWLWGKLVSSTALTGRPVIAFEYSDEAVRKGFELSRLTLPQFLQQVHHFHARFGVDIFRGRFTTLCLMAGECC